MKDAAKFLEEAIDIESDSSFTTKRKPPHGAWRALRDYWSFIDLIDFRGGTEKFSGVHKELVDFITEPQTACVGTYRNARNHTNYGRRRLVLVARGHLKSTLCSVGYVLWRIYRNPNIRICVGTATKDLALQFVKEIKQYLENEDLQERVWNVRPHIKGRMVPVLDKAGARRRDRLRQEDDTEAVDKKVVWRSDAIQLIRNQIYKEPTIVAASPGSNITGMHFDLIIKDDIINDDTVATPKKIADTLNWAQDLESILDPQRKVLLHKGLPGVGELWEIVGDEDLVLGTRYAKDDYYDYILQNLDSLGYKTFVRNVFKNGEDNSEGYTWGERFNDFVVDNIKRRMSPKRFASQYLNRIIAQEDQILKLDAITVINPLWFEIENGKCRINFPDKGAKEVSLQLIVDPAVSQKKNADNTVIMVGGFDDERNLYALDVAWGKMLPEKLIAEIFRMVEKWKLPRVTIEVVAFQQVLVHMVRSAFTRFRPIGVNEFRPKGEKKARIASMLEPYFANNKVFVAKNVHGVPQFREEIEYFTNDPNSNMHDDFVDCLAIIAEVGQPAPKPQYRQHNRGRLINMAINSKWGGIYVFFATLMGTYTLLLSSLIFS